MLDQCRTSVSDISSIIPRLLLAFDKLTLDFVGGQISSVLSSWRRLTSDAYILELVTGARIRFTDRVYPNTYKHKTFSVMEAEFIAAEVNSLLSKRVIVTSTHEDDQYISPLFLTPKKGGGHRFILNLKGLNTHVEYHHFKMCGISHILTLVSPACLMASIDIKDAYYSVPIHSCDQKYLKFMWDGVLYQFLVLPNGLSPGPRWFTKLMKPVMATLRERLFTNSIYIDDIFLLGDTMSEVNMNIVSTIELLVSLNLFPHPTKCQLQASHKLDILGFTINSLTMRVSLTSEKRDSLLEGVTTFSHRSSVKIRELAAIVGRLVAAFPGSQFGPLFYRGLEARKQLGLQNCKGNFEASVSLDSTCKAELSWWIHQLLHMSKPILFANPRYQLYTDASNTGWGAHLKATIPQGRGVLRRALTILM